MVYSVASSVFQRSSIAVAVLAASLAAAPNSYAQLEEVVVTAQKREQSANDVGITINANAHKDRMTQGTTYTKF